MCNNNSSKLLTEGINIKGSMINFNNLENINRQEATTIKNIAVNRVS